MTIYHFETIAPDQALTISEGDALVFSSGTATQISVVYDPNGDITVSLGAQSVEFGVNFAALSQNIVVSQTGPVTTQIRFDDGSLLYVGDGHNNSLGAGQTPFDAAAFGGGGDDSLSGGGLNNLLQGNAGADELEGLNGSNTIYGGQGDDTLGVLSGTDRNFLQGNKGDDQISGGLGSNTILGGQGSDTLSGQGAHDYLDGNLGNDWINSNGNHAQVLGEDGDDYIFVGSGGFDTISAGAGDDTISLTDSGGDSVDGGDGNDSIAANSAADTVTGGAGNDIIRIGGAGDVVDAGDGNDHIVVDTPNVTVNGGAGNDTIEIQTAEQIIFGGGGKDLFEIETYDSRVGSAPSQRDEIMDWSSQDHIHNETLNLAKMTYSEATAPDEIALSSNFPLAPDAIMAVQVGTSVFVLMQPDNASGPPLNTIEAITLPGRSLADIDASNFI